MMVRSGYILFEHPGKKLVYPWVGEIRTCLKVLSEIRVFGTSSSYWVVRKSADGGATWTTVDTYQLLTAGTQRALGFASDSLGNLYVAGEALASGGVGPNYWIVRENPGGTGSWITVDTVTNSIPHAIAADGLGNVFVGGQNPG